MDNLENMTFVDRQVTQANDNTLPQLYQDARDALRRANFLAEAGVILSSSLDYAARLTNLAHFIVTYLADWCVIDMLNEDDQSVRRLAIAHTDPSKQDVARRLQQRYAVLELHASHTITNVLESGKAWLDPEITEERFVAQARDAEHLQCLRALGFKSEMVVPITVRGHSVGTITFIRGESAPRYGADDLKVAEQVAQRTAAAVDQSRLYYEARQARQAAERAVERTNRLQAITAALSEALTPQQVTEVILTQTLAITGAAAGFIALLTDDSTALETAQVSGYTPSTTASWQRFPINAKIPLADAVCTAAPIWIESHEVLNDLYPHLAINVSPISKASASLPFLVKGRAIGAIGLSFGEFKQFTSEDKAYLQMIAQQCAQAIERSRLYAAERQARERAELAQRQLAFLAEVSRVLGASLDPEAALVQLAHLVLTVLADYCIIDVMESNGSIRRVATAHVDASKEALMVKLREFPPDPQHTEGIPHVLRTGNVQIMYELSDTYNQAIAHNAEHLSIIQALAPRSGMIMPLVARERVLGAMSLLMSDSGRLYSPEDVVLAEEVAYRAAIAVDNARLYQQAQQEIAQRELVEASLRLSEQQLRLVTDALPILIAYIDRERRYRFNNKAYESWFGQKTEDVTDKYIWEAIGEEAYQTIKPHVEQALSGQEVHFETTMPYKNGPRHIFANYVPHVEEDGRTQGYFAVVIDITERKQAETAAAYRVQQLSVLNHVLQAALEPADLGNTLDVLLTEICAIFKVDAADIYSVDFNTQTLSPMARRGYQLAEGEKVQLSLDSGFRGEVVHQGKVLQFTKGLSPQPSTFIYYPAAFKAIAVTPIWIRDTIIGTLAIFSWEQRVFTDEESALLETLGRGIGITIENARLYSEVQSNAETLKRKVEERTDELQRALIRVQSADHAKSVMISTVSHEMRTPLSSIIGFSNLILSRKPEQAKLQSYVTAINVEARRLADLVNDFLDLQRIETGREVFRFVDVNLADLIYDVVQKHTMDEGSPHTIRLDLKPVPYVYIDPNRIRQVLINLLTNAIKYSPNGGEIVLSLELKEGEVVFAIQDQGLGIPPEEITQIFEAFQRGRVAEYQRIRGTGLGLALSRKIINSHNGQIWAESAGSNQGSTFRFSLPIGSRAGIGQREATGSGRPGTMIAVIEDDAHFSAYLVERLSPEGFDVRLLRFEGAAPDIIAQLAPAVIVLDVLQGDRKPGWTLLLELKQNPLTHAIPVIVCSALNDADQAFRLGASSYIIKPVDEATLIGEIVRLTNNSTQVTGDQVPPTESGE